MKKLSGPLSLWLRLDEFVDLVHDDSCPKGEHGKAAVKGDVVTHFARIPVVQLFRTEAANDGHGNTPAKEDEPPRARAAASCILNIRVIR
jgi:hypothetical protein